MDTIMLINMSGNRKLRGYSDQNCGNFIEDWLFVSLLCIDRS